MAGNRTTEGRQQSAVDPGWSLVDGFGSMADDLRQVAVDMGLRPYRVWVVAVEWSGEAPGKGTARVVQDFELLPTPIVDLRGLRSDFKAGGKAERGSAKIQEISPRYSEAEISGLFHVKRGREVFIEIAHDSRDPEPQARRRFGIRGVPYRNTDNFCWDVGLEREVGDRTPGKAVDGPKLHHERRPL